VIRHGEIWWAAPPAGSGHVSQLLTLDERFLTERVARLAPAALRNVEAGLRLVLAL
jgi:hypothetical protein